MLDWFKPDVILSDLSMPVEDGYSLSRAQRISCSHREPYGTPKLTNLNRLNALILVVGLPARLSSSSLGTNHSRYVREEKVRCSPIKHTPGRFPLISNHGAR